jgi:hypothetical protein
MGEKRNACRILVRIQKEIDHWEDLDIGERIKLRWILHRMGWYGLD